MTHYSVQPTDRIFVKDYGFYFTANNLEANEEILREKYISRKYASLLMNPDDYINRMETSISDPAKFQKLLVLENKNYNFMVKEKRLVDNVLDTLYEKNAISHDTKTILLMDQALHVYMIYQKFIKH